jgi:hypothetical protein
MSNTPTLGVFESSASHKYTLDLKKKGFLQTFFNIYKDNYDRLHAIFTAYLDMQLVGGKCLLIGLYAFVCLWLAEVCIATLGTIVEFQLKLEYLKSERLFENDLQW